MTRPGLVRTPVLTPVLLAAVFLMPGKVLPQANSGAPENPEIVERCSGPEYREFDFWLGTWEVRSSEGDLLGRNTIRRVAGGCGLLESWRGFGSSQGISINAYDGERNKWTQRWVGAGTNLWLEGDLEDGQMVLAGTAPRSTRDGKVLDRITWTPLPDGRLRQHWEISTDNGNSWKVLFDGFYVPAPENDGVAFSMGER